MKFSRRTLIIIISIVMLTTIMKITGLFAAIAGFIGQNAAETRPTHLLYNPKMTLHDFKIKSLDGKEIDLSIYKGKKVVILNTASACGYTPQYGDWQKFHEANKDKVVVLGFPSNDFGGQEPGSNEQIGAFCQKNYGVSFQMFTKVATKKGDDQHPLYKWLSSKDLNGWNEKAPSWNFCKYVINEKGELTHFFASGVKPASAEFTAAIQ